MKLECNQDYIACRYRRYVNAKEEEDAAENKIKQLEERIKTLQNELYHTYNEVTLTIRIQNNCLDDIAWLEQYSKDGKEFEKIDAFEDKGVEITKGWRLRK